MKLEYPYCKNELIKGFFYSGGCSFKWHDENAGLLERTIGFGGEIVSHNEKVICYRCKNCNKIIIDLNEL
ncbi:MAG: PF20097 family protein [Marinisporobacter sp.]|jgi:hypothetical protein|nr:PF20097 family protein [Marinisporobacter sp.]